MYEVSLEWEEISDGITVVHTVRATGDNPSTLIGLLQRSVAAPAGTPMVLRVTTVSKVP